MKAYFSILSWVMVTAAAVSCGPDRDMSGRLQDVAHLQRTSGQEIAVRVRPQHEVDGQVRAVFYTDAVGAPQDFVPMFGGDILLKDHGPLISLMHDGTEIGQIRGDRLLLCDRYELDGEILDFPCSVTFFYPGFSPSVLPAAESARFSSGFRMDLGLAKPGAASALSGQGAPVTLESFAQNQINQFGTGTCAYNAATGIMEILYAQEAGVVQNFSEPFYLAYAPRFGSETAWFWNKYERMASEMDGQVRNEHLPVTSIYKQGVSFSSAQQNAISWYDRNGGDPVELPFLMRGEKLFFRAEWRDGYMRGQGRASEQDYELAVDWFLTHQRPVNVHYWINSVWHSVVMIGYDPGSGQVMIKDSLGNTHLKGTWKSKSWFLANVYAAIGVSVSDDASGSPADGGAARP